MGTLYRNGIHLIPDLEDHSLISLVTYQKVASVSKDKIRNLYLPKIRNQFLKLLFIADADKALNLTAYPKGCMSAHRLFRQDILLRYICADELINS